ncbi:U3 small nucleolar RNA-associated protein 13 [Nowakowskiella sp. JEL0407]|nr:U3 small nucleolar RNA-associated protein 13 [Nowakowskiella sp. JEL0407]
MDLDNRRILLRTNFDKSNTIETIYTGGHFSCTPSYLALPCEESVILLNASSLSVSETLSPKILEISAVLLSHCNSTLIAASKSGEIAMYSSESLSNSPVTNSNLTRTFKAHDAPILCLAFPPPNSQPPTVLATGSSDSSIRVWNIKSHYVSHNLRKHANPISVLKFFNDVTLFSASVDCTIVMWDLISSSVVRVFESHLSAVSGINFFNFGNDESVKKKMKHEVDGMMVTAGRDKVLNVWSLSSGKLLKTVLSAESVESMAIFKHLETADPHVVVGGESGIARVYNLNAGKVVAEYNLGSAITEINVLDKDDTDMLIFSTVDCNIHYFDVSIGNDGIEFVETKLIPGYNDEIIDLKYAGPNEEYLVVATNSNHLRVYELSTMNCKLVRGHEDVIVTLDVSKCGNVVVTGSKDKSVCIYQLGGEDGDDEREFELVARASGHTEGVTAVSICRKNLGFVVSSSEDNTIKKWDLSHVNFSGKKPMPVVQLSSIYTFQPHPKAINAISVSPNSALFASASLDKTVKIWSTESGDLKATCNGHKKGVWSCEFSKVDKVLVSGGSDRCVKVWNLDGTCLKTFEGHLNSVLKTTFISHGMQIVSSGSDGLVKVWTLKTNLCEVTLDNHEDKVWALTTKKDDSVIISGAADSVITFWKDTTVQKREEEYKAKEEGVKKSQSLENSIQKKDYKTAIKLALELNHAFKLVNLINLVLKNEGEENLKEVVAGLNPEQLSQLLNHTLSYTTTTKYSYPAHLTLYQILSQFDKSSILALPESKKLLNGLRAYTEKVFDGVDKALVDLGIVELCLQD